MRANEKYRVFFGDRHSRGPAGMLLMTASGAAHVRARNGQLHNGDERAQSVCERRLLHLSSRGRPLCVVRTEKACHPRRASRTWQSSGRLELVRACAHARTHTHRACGHKHIACHIFAPTSPLNWCRTLVASRTARSLWTDVVPFVRAAPLLK